MTYRFCFAVWLLLTACAFGRPATVSGTHSTQWSPLSLAPTTWHDGQDPSTMYDATSGGALVADGGVVARWEDKSGHGYHATQGTAGKQLVRSAARGGLSQPLLTGGGMRIASRSVNRRSFSYFAIVEPTSLRRANLTNSMFFSVGTGGSANFFNFYWDQPGKPLVYPGLATPSNYTFDTSSCLVGITCDASALTFYTDTNSSTAAALAAGTGTSMTLAGSSDNDWPLKGTIKEILTWDRALTLPEVNLLRRYSLQKGNQRNSPLNVGFDGDSITAGLGSYTNSGWPVQMKLKCLAHNWAESSKRLTALITEAATHIDLSIIPGKTNVLFLFAATNDITLDSRTAAQVYTDTVNYCTARKAAGWNKIIIVGMLPRSAVETQRLDLRTALKADFSVSSAASCVYTPHAGVTYADAYLDTFENPDIGPFEARNTSKYDDGVHPSDSGYAVLATLATGALGVIHP